jgi:hypothetical protein
VHTGSQIENEVNSDADVRELFVFDEHQQPTLFVDTGVYTKNRCFRLYLSSKRDKHTFLTRADTNLCTHSGMENIEW